MTETTFMPEPIKFTADRARARILASHGLTTPADEPLEAVRCCIAVQTQYAASLPVASAARTRRPKANWEQDALQRGDLIKAWTLRSTIHTQTPEDYIAMIEASGAQRRARHIGWMKGLGIDEPELREMEEGLLEALAGGPLNRQQLHEHVPQYKGMPWVGWGVDLMGLAFLGKITLLSPPKGPTLFKLADPVQFVREPNEAAAYLALRYFESYGPATARDFPTWLGLAASRLKPALALARDRLTSVEIDGFKGERFIVGRAEAPPHRGLRLLAKFDPLMMGFKDRSLFLTPEQHKAIFRPAGQVEATVLENGQITGTWRLERAGARGCLSIWPFNGKPPRSKSEIERQLAKLKAASGLKSIDLKINS